MKKNYKISLAIDSFFPDTKAGTEIYVLNLAKNLQKNGFDVSVIAACVEKENYFYEYEEIKVYRFKVPKKETVKKLNGFGKPSGIEEFEKIIDKIKPEIIHFHSFSRALNSHHLQLCKQKNITTVFTSHTGVIACNKGSFLYHNKVLCNGKVDNFRCLECFIFDKIKNKFLSKIVALCINVINFLKLSYFFPSFNIIKNRKNEIKRLSKYCDIIIPISKWVIPIYEKNKILKYKYIAQGINTELFNKKNENNLNQTSLIRMVFVGRIVVLKRINLLLQLLSKIDNNKFELTIIANKGNEPIYFEEFTKLKKKIKNLKYFEAITQNEISEILGNGDILLLPSIFEMAPLVILEAFAKKVPVLGSSYPAIAEMIEDGKTGIIFENNNEKDLLEKLSYIIENSEKIREMKKNIPPVNSFENVAKEHIELYNQLLNK